MDRCSYLFLIFFILISAKSFSQFGLIAEANFSSFSDEDLNNSSGIGYGFGIAFKEEIYEKGDFIAEFTYTSNKIVLDGYETFDPTERADVKFSADNLNLTFLYTQYVINNDEAFFFGPQLGPIFMFSNEWKAEETYDNSRYSYEPLGYTNDDFEQIKPFNAGLVLGLTTGYSWLRVNIRYQLALTNTLRKFTYLEEDGPREPELKQNSFSLSINYLIN
ncbi:porin family protein [Marixanthomonas ophiurae]|uniref:PorT family protein n=1 Tax=Marixanthomonas ophiurae TaxID=387659 RepID=A0A3E1QAL9_9FLAO|nr:outer membrane beta-barrel protein [Marixanthomonas ophiurae]RFN59185.1 PorT family protein [Marixanthomonas ophiurae]